jgi:hypothetical protein
MKVHLLGKGYRRFSITFERVGMFSIVQEPQYNFTYEIITKATWKSDHKHEQKFFISISRYVNIDFHKPK